MTLALTACAVAAVLVGAEPESAPPPAPPPAVATAAAPTIMPPPPDVVAGERSDGRLDPLPKRRWRLVPQVLMSPLRGLFWLIRWPVGPALRLEDRKHPMGRLVSWLTWNDGARGLRPAFYYSTIYVPEFGLRYFDNLTLGVDTRMSLTATVGGARYVFADFYLEPTRTTEPVGISFAVSFDRRGDLLYNGLGSHTFSAAPAGRYLMNALDGRMQVRLRPARGLTLFATLGSGFKRFDNGDRIGGDPGIIFVYDTATIPGFARGTTFVRTGAGFSLDLRDAPVRSSTGFLLQAAFDFTRGLDDDAASYERLSATASVPIRLWSPTHVLWLKATTAIAWQNDAPIPFSELPTLGGPNDLRGFRFQDFRDYSAFYATAEYRWPAWMWVDAALFVDYGGVFGQNYANFGARRMQPDLGVALHVVTSREFYIRVQLGYGFGEGL
ncbi:MAG: hypothetical protein JWM53_5325, partial [bacterium]|nr:hypothetical protein [bacterium]